MFSFIALQSLSASFQEQSVNVLQTIQFVCEFSGIPLPHVNWSMSSHETPVGAIFTGRAYVTNDNTANNTVISTLTLQSIQLEDAGKYMCIAVNGEIYASVIYNLTTGEW